MAFRRGRWRPFFSAGIFLAVVGPPLAGLEIHDFDGARHLRFEEGTFPGAPVPNGMLWASTYDFGGVGWSMSDTRKGFALISPRHFVGSNHFRPPINSQVAFRGSDGEVRLYTYVKFYNLKNAQNEETDIFIGELAENIPARHGVPLYPVPAATESELAGGEIIVYGRGVSGPRIGRGKVGAFSDSFGSGSTLNDTRNYHFDYREITAEQDDAHGEIGDSGSPSFIPLDGMLAVAGVHSTVRERLGLLSGTTISTHDSYILHYKDQINAHLAGTGHQLIVAPVQDAGLSLIAMALVEESVILEVWNPAQIPYDVERTADLRAEVWDTVATGQTGPLWVGETPAGADRLFWRLVPYPLPLDDGG